MPPKAETSPNLRCILAPNPSPMTGPGTNTYILGRGEVAVIDPGPRIVAHLSAIMAALSPQERVTAILVTHAHLDHSDLAPDLSKATGAPVLAFGGPQDGRSPAMQAWYESGGTSGGEGVDTSFHPDRKLGDGEVVRIGDLAVTALHTPGHFSNHLCFACDGMILTGDLVMAWASTLISPPDGDVGDYRCSLTRLLQYGANVFHPGHGAPVPDPAGRITALLEHRQAREDAIRAQLGAGLQSVTDLTLSIYTDIPSALLPAAQRNVLAHLIDLQNRGLAYNTGGDSFWQRI